MSCKFCTNSRKEVLAPTPQFTAFYILLNNLYPLDSYRRGSMTVPKRFGVLRFFGTLLKVIAWIILVLAILGAIGAALASSMIADQVGPALSSNPVLSGLLGTGGGIVAGIFILIMGLIYFLILYVMGENLHLQLA